MVEKETSEEENVGITEDFCFCCKDGGQLLLCDHKGCLKAYHPECVGQDESIIENAASCWNCNWHSCDSCKQSSKYQCFLCPKAYCGRCNGYQIVPVRGNKGFCHRCLWLTKLIEDNVDADSDGERINFDDQTSVEWLFREYWWLRKVKENLTSEDVYSADKKLRKQEKYRCDADYEFETDDEDDELGVSDYDESYDLEESIHSHKKKSSKRKECVSKGMVKEKKKEFMGWASKSLIEFLSSIGKDTSKQLSQYEVTDIITRYCEENKLFHPEKRKKILCDAKLQSLLGRKILLRNKIYDRLETHFAENMEQSNDDEIKSSSEDDENGLLASKRQRKSSPTKNSLKKEVVPAVQQSIFASIVPQNINLVYLRRSLVEKLLEQPETFDGKVVGSFVRVKSDPNDIWQKNPFMLVQVKGIKKTSCVGDKESSILLQVSNMPNDFPINKLLDDDVSEEECKDLHQRMVQGLLTRPSVVELQKKVKTLHEDITKHRIVRELALLRNLIDHANEKGKRRELSEYMERKKLLETPSEQARMLENVPEVFAEPAELQPTCADSSRKDQQENNNGSAEVSIRRPPKTPIYTFKENWASSSANGRTNATGDINLANGDNASGTIEPGIAIKRNNEEAVNKQFTAEDTTGAKQHQSGAREFQNSRAAQRNQSQGSSETSYPQNSPRAREVLPKTKQSHSDIASGNNKKHTHQAALQQHCKSQIEIIELSDDDDNDNAAAAADDDKASIRKQDCEDDDKWYCESLHGVRRGPLRLSVLKLWREARTYDLKWKAWKAGQREDEAIDLDDALYNAFYSK